MTDTTPAETREDGFYWVRRKSQREPEVARLDNASGMWRSATGAMCSVGWSGIEVLSDRLSPP